MADIKTRLEAEFALGKDTPNFKRLERKAMGDGDTFGSLYVDPKSIPEGATKAIVVVSFE